MQKGVLKVGRGITNGPDVIFMENEEDHGAFDLRLLSGCIIHIQMHPAEPPKLQWQQGIICAFGQLGHCQAQLWLCRSRDVIFEVKEERVR
jgi:hypothetical protein